MGLKGFRRFLGDFVLQEIPATGHWFRLVSLYNPLKERLLALKGKIQWRQWLYEGVMVLAILGF